MASLPVQCTPNNRAWRLIRQVATADAYELRRLLTALNTPRSCDQHEQLCVIESHYIRGLIMFKAARDIRRHDWMLSQSDSLHNALSLFDEALQKIKQVRKDPETPYDTWCTLGLLERSIVFEAMAVISLFETTWKVTIPADSKPDTGMLFSPDLLDIKKARTCGFALRSRQLPQHSKIA